MSTNDVPGYNSSNRDELRAGCWAEHQDGSLIYVYAVEADMVSYRIFDMTKSPPIEYLDRMPVKEFGELFSCNPQDINKVIAVPRGKDKKRVTKQVYTWHDKTPFPVERILDAGIDPGPKVTPAPAVMESAARKVAKALQLRAKEVDPDDYDHQHDRTVALTIGQKIGRAIDQLLG